MNQSFQTALPQEQQTLKTGTGFLPEALDFSGGTTAQSFASGKAALARQLAQAGISPDDPRYIAEMSQFQEGESKAFDSNILNQLMQNFQAKQGAAKDLLQFGSAQNPLQAYATLMQTILNS